MDFTGCGNTPRIAHPRVMQLVVDSLRYWVTEMHVDGFRFDLATALARESLEADVLGTFFQVVQQDPVLSRVKLIAEPWDAGPGGYLVGGFPSGWTEWNGEYRDTVRDFWAGRPVPARKLAHRLCGSPDLYDRTGRKPHASVNFVTCHDGFTLADLVSYEAKRNAANGEDSRDGEGTQPQRLIAGSRGRPPTPAVLAVRDRQRRNLLATLFVSQGRAHAAGRRRTQPHPDKGTTTPTARITPSPTWTGPTPPRPPGPSFLRFVKRLARLWHEQPVLHRRNVLLRPVGPRRRGRATSPGSPRPGKEPVADADWDKPVTPPWPSGWPATASPRSMRRAEPIVGDTLFVALNAGVARHVTFVLPDGRRPGRRGSGCMDTADPDARGDRRRRHSTPPPGRRPGRWPSSAPDRRPRVGTGRDAPTGRRPPPEARRPATAPVPLPTEPS